MPTRRGPLTGRVLRSLRPVPTARALAVTVDHRGPQRRRALRERISQIIGTLGLAPAPELSTEQLLQQLAACVGAAPIEATWLTLSVLRARLPDVDTVTAVHRRIRLDGALPALAPTLLAARRPGPPHAGGEWPRVEIVVGAVLVDLHHTARTSLATGIQRVARQTSSRWQRDHDPVLVGWTRDLRALRRLDAREISNALHGDVRDLPPVPAVGPVVIPWHSRYVLPELLTERPRAQALHALLRFSPSPGSVIGFDCVPITAAETTSAEMGAKFALMLAAIAHAEAVAAISASAATEYTGWRSMLGGTGSNGPDIAEIALPVQLPEPSTEAAGSVRAVLGIDDRALVLCVGSHEPRKNHLAVVQAAELLWRRDVRFALVFVGGNAWGSAEFTERVAQLQAAGRSIHTVRALSDDLLHAAYRTARCTVFPSLIEGFGLPVAESLAAGTPVITSDFGSMAELAAPGGALLVDPHDDHAIAAAIRRLLTDDELHAALAAEAAARPARSWDDYARDAWAYLVERLPVQPDPVQRYPGERRPCD